MKVTVVGTSCTWFKRNNTSFIIDDDIVFDTPDGAYKDIINYIDIFKIRCIIITHFHTDHFTDLHIFDYMNKSNYERFDLQETLPIDAAAYTDYNKKEIKNYVLYKSDTYSGSIYYVSNDKFYQPRNPIYKYNVLKEYDKERINIFVNSIAYSYIDYLPYSEEIKNILRDNYQLMDASSFRFIVGNKDWFIAIDSGLSLITYLLYKFQIPMFNHMEK